MAYTRHLFNEKGEKERKKPANLPKAKVRGSEKKKCEIRCDKANKQGLNRWGIRPKNIHI